MKRLHAIAATALIAACSSTPEEREAQARYERQQQIQYEIKLADQCSRYGFTGGTPEFRECVMRLDMAEKQRRAAALDGAMNAVIGNPGITSMPTYRSAPPPRLVTP